MNNNTLQHKGILIFASHPIQYNAPMYKKLSEKFDIKVAYFSDRGLKSREVKGLGNLPEWDIPLLDGYKYVFLKNYSIFSDKNTFFSRINFGVISEIYNWKGQYVWVSGWNYFSNILAILTCFLLRKKILVRSDSNAKDIPSKRGSFYYLFNYIPKHMLIHSFYRVLYIGLNNKKYFEFYKVPEEKFIFTPFSVDNERFQDKFNELIVVKNHLKQKLNIPEKDKVILFVGRLVPAKNPELLLLAFAKLKNINTHLVFVGAGYMEKNILSMAQKLNVVDRVKLVGYKNQSELPAYFVMSDVFVLPSTYEPWGLVVNEAMNNKLPIIVSTVSGCAEDLVINNENGFIFEPKNEIQLTSCIEKVIESDDLNSKMGMRSLEIINHYSFDVVVDNLWKYL